MTIEQIYGENKPLIERQYADMFNYLVRRIESDGRFALADDEMNELIGDLIVMYLREQKWDRLSTEETAV